MKVGAIVKAPISFIEGDGRAKVRPCMVVATATAAGEQILLLAPRYGSEQGDAQYSRKVYSHFATGFDKAGYWELGAKLLKAVKARDCIATSISFNALPQGEQAAIRQAARSLPGVRL